MDSNHMVDTIAKRHTCRRRTGANFAHSSRQGVSPLFPASEVYMLSEVEKGDKTSESYTAYWENI